LQGQRMGQAAKEKITKKGLTKWKKAGMITWQLA
jgi:hypothetical protein